MAHTRLYYHLVWSTKHRLALLECDIRADVFGLLRVKAIGLGAAVYAIGGSDDHVHLVVSIPAAISVSKFVGQIKGYSAHTYNKTYPRRSEIRWQDGYGAFTIERSRLAYYVKYVEGRGEHHELNKGEA